MDSVEDLDTRGLLFALLELASTRIPGTLNVFEEWTRVNYDSKPPLTVPFMMKLLAPVISARKLYEITLAHLSLLQSLAAFHHVEPAL
jgi:hypothetical protein